MADVNAERSAEVELDAMDRLLRRPSRRFEEESLLGEGGPGPNERKSPLEIDEEPSEEQELGKPLPLADAEDVAKCHIS